MPLLLLLLALALGCAAPTQSTYSQAAPGPAFPAPPSTPPGSGAPMVGQPGQQAPELPRSPHHRPLPPTAEPGLWAGDAPQASRSGPQEEPVLLGVTLPGLPITDTDKDVGPARACIAMWGQALPGTKLEGKVNALRPAEKRCMVALMFRDCARVLEELDDASREKGVVVLLARQKRAKLRQTADDFAREACARVPVTDAQRRLLDSLRAALRRSSEEPE